MNIIMTIFAFIGVLCCCFAGLTVVAITYHSIQEKKEYKKKDNRKEV